MRLAPKCTVCGGDMELVDAESRRWRCKNDNVRFLSKEGWTREGQAPSPSDQIATPKSYGVGFLANFLLPGAGLIYAGKKVSLIYTILTVVFLVVLWSIGIVVVVASYVNTIVAIKDRNEEAKRTSRPYHEIKPAEELVLGVSSMKENVQCGSCGGQINPNSVYCPICGTKVSGVRRGAIDSDSERTRFFE